MLLCWERSQALRYCTHVQAVLLSAAESLGVEGDAVVEAAATAAQLSPADARAAMRQATGLHVRAALLQRAAAAYGAMKKECEMKFARLPSTPRAL